MGTLEKKKKTKGDAPKRKPSRSKAEFIDKIKASLEKKNQEIKHQPHIHQPKTNEKETKQIGGVSSSSVTDGTTEQHIDYADEYNKQKEEDKESKVVQSDVNLKVSNDSDSVSSQIMPSSSSQEQKKKRKRKKKH